jgi:hypothetical protein
VDQYRILALPYPVQYQVFWQLLADIGVTQEYLMDRMGASPWPALISARLPSGMCG